MKSKKIEKGLDSVKFSQKVRKENFYNELREAVNEVNLIEAGKKKGRDAKEFLKSL